MKKNHVDLSRRFRVFKEDEADNSNVLEYSDFGNYGTEGWEKLLTYKRVVVLAEPGTGKTAEFKTQAQYLIDNGKPAFFVEIKVIAEGGFLTSLKPEDRKRFEKWSNGQEEAWFFLDSVDEARNLGKQLQLALLSLANALGGGAKRAHIYISSRITDWRSDSDPELISDVLKVVRIDEPAEQDSTEDLNPSGDALLVLLHNSSGHSQEDDSKPSDVGKDRPDQDPKTEELKIFHLVPLSRDRIEKFAKEYGVENVAAFMEALNETEAIDFAGRPQDLISKIARWKEHGTLGSHYDELGADISYKLKETNPKHSEKLSLDKAKAGAETIAGALTLCKKPFLIRENSEIDPEIKSNALDVSDLMTNWAPADYKALLDKPIFSSATYGTVNFHHRSVQEILTAEWILHLIEAGCPRNEIYRLLFPKKYGHHVVPTSLIPVAAWLGQRDEGVRKQIFKYAPEILLEHGDPELLPIQARIELLKHLASLYSGRNDIGANFDFQNVTRFADPKLAPVIKELWKAYPNDEDLCDLLLGLIWRGKISDNCDIALSAICRNESTPHHRIRGIFALHSAGSDQQKEAAAKALMENAKDWPARVIGEGIRHFFPDFLTKDNVITLIHAIEETQGEDTLFGLPSNMSDLANDVSEKIAEILLDIFLQLVREEPSKEFGGEKISSRYQWALKPLEALCTRLLAKSTDYPSDRLAAATELVCVAESYLCKVHLDTAEIKKIVSKNKKLNRFFFLRTIEHRRAEFKAKDQNFNPFLIHPGLRAPWGFSAGDFDWLIKEISDHADLDVRQVCLLWAFRVWNSSGRDKSLKKRLQAVASGNSVLSQRLKSLFSPAPDPEQERWKEEDRKYALKRAKQQKEEDDYWLNFRRELQTDPGQLRDAKATKTPKNFNHLRKLRTFIRQAVGNPNVYGLHQWEELTPLFGREVAEAARDGMISFWRTYEPPLYSEGAENITTHGSELGLTGLAIEASYKPDWIKSLSADEAILATRYAVGEMNGFPFWLPELAECHPEQVSQVFAAEIAWELNWKEEGKNPHHVVSRLAYENDELKKRFAPQVLEQLEKTPCTTTVILSNAFRILLGSDNLDATCFEKLAKKRLHGCEAGSQGYFLWLAGWMCVNAEAALTYVEQKLLGMNAKGQDSFIQSLLATLFDHRSLTYGFVHADFLKFEALIKLLPWVYKIIRVADDQQRDGGVYTPNSRDAMESARGFLLQQFYQIPGEQTYRTLLVFSKRPEFSDFSERLLVLADQRAAEDADKPKWFPQDVKDFMHRYTKPVQCTQDLFDVTLYRLADIQFDLEEGDDEISKEAIRQDWSQYKNEPRIQKWYAKQLRETARKQYVTFREVEVTGGNKTDIMIAHPEAEGPITIEVKVADSCTYPELMDALKDQLVGKYLREKNSKFGILLMTRHRQGRWKDKDTGFWLSYSEVVGRLEALAKKILDERSDIEGLEIVAIDLMQSD